MLAFSAVSLIRLRLPAGHVNTSVLHLSMSIRDQQDSLTEFNLSSVVVLTDSDEIDQFLVDLQGSGSSSSNANPLVQILSSGNQNAVGQVVSSLSQQFNQINTDALRTAVESEHSLMPGCRKYPHCSVLDGIPLTSVAVSDLGSRSQPMVSSDRASSLSQFICLI